jgi:hypothetical protein
MAVCSLCGKPQDAVKQQTVYTARQLSATTQKTGFKQYTTTTLYGEFEPHTYGVCHACSMRRNILYPVAAYILSIPLFMLLGLDFAGALIFAIAGAGIAWWQLNPTKSLLRIALAARQRVQRATYKGYTQQAYSMLPGNVAASQAAATWGAANAGVALRATASGCWFCTQGHPADGEPHKVALFKLDAGTRHQDTVWIPRCAICEATHRRLLRLQTTLSFILAALAIGISIAAGVISGQSIGGWGWAVGVIVLLAVVIGGALGLLAVSRHLAASWGTRTLSAANAGHPEVQARLAAGWQIDAQVGNKATPPAHS